MNIDDRRFFGNYRGKVANNHDPAMLGRITAFVPALFGNEETGWALPCTPYAGKNVGFYFIPPHGANIWIEFEEGNINNPIWTGCFWGIGDLFGVPSIGVPLGPKVKAIKTDFTLIRVEDTQNSGFIKIQTKRGSTTL
jgi:Type VI secretion system/phage-baseplate injector OB domain